MTNTRPLTADCQQLIDELQARIAGAESEIAEWETIANDPDTEPDVAQSVRDLIRRARVKVAAWHGRLAMLRLLCAHPPRQAPIRPVPDFPFE